MVHVIKKRPYVSFGLAALLIAAVIFAVVPYAHAWGGRRLLVLNVDLAAGSGFDIDDSDGDGNGPFHIDGTIRNRNGNAIGKFRCWGWARTDSGTIVSQEYRLDGHGTIVVLGEEAGAKISVAGGTGKFANIRGEGIFGPYADGIPGGGFSIAFNSGRGGGDDDDD